MIFVWVIRGSVLFAHSARRMRDNFAVKYRIETVRPQVFALLFTLMLQPVAHESREARQRGALLR
jgi:hypothetical protein